jgi:predicted PurR-regulated permease PerM
VSQKFSFYALVGTVLAVGVLFFRVVQPFLIPLFLAAVLALLFYPIYASLAATLRGHRYVASGLMTVSILLLCLLPLGAALIFAGQELLAAGQELLQTDLRQQPGVSRIVEFARTHVSEEQWEELRGSAKDAVQVATQEVYDRTRALLSNIIGFVVGLAVMGLSLFYFLAEGPSMLRTLHRISPLEDADDEVLFRKFDQVCRSVVLASIVCALAQAILAGIGFAVMGMQRVWLLAGATMLVSLVPFVGSAGVWGAVAVYLALNGALGKAILLAIYGATIVSTSDNIIRAYVIHGKTNLHPLVALISVLGAIRVVGLWGVFVGPIVAAVFYTLLKTLHDRMDSGEPASGPLVTHPAPAATPPPVSRQPRAEATPALPTPEGARAQSFSKTH